MNEEEGRTEVGGEPEVSGVPAVQEEAKSIAEIREGIRKGAGLDVRKWPDERLQVIAKTCVPEGTSAAEMAYFLGVCDRYGLAPEIGEAWLVQDEKNAKLMILTGRDSYLKIAESDPDYGGFEAGVVYENDAFEIIRDGGEISITHVIGKDRGKRLLAFALVFRSGRRPTLVVRQWTMYASLQGKKNWRNNPDDMLETRVITTAHRYAYRISGVYTKDEIDTTDFREPESKATGTGKSNGGNGGNAPTAAEATEARLANLRKEVSSHDETVFGGTVEGEDVTEPEPEGPVIPILQRDVEFGKYGPNGDQKPEGQKTSTWGWVFSSSSGLAYVKHYVLSDQCEHASVSNEVRELLGEALAQHNAGNAPQKPEEPSNGEGDAGSSPEDAEDEPTALSMLWDEAQTLAADLAKLEALDPDDAVMIDEFKAAGDVEEMAALRDKLRRQLRKLIDGGADPQLGF